MHFEPEIIVAVCGPKRSGKDTFGDYLCEHYGFTKVAYADPIKEALKPLFGLTDKQLYGEEKETIVPEYGATPRYIMQRLGTDFCRNNFGKDIFVNIIKKRIIDRRISRVVITDVRFPNEAKLAKHFQNGYIIKVSRPNLEQTAGSHHISEQLFDEINCDDFLENDGTKKEYEDKIQLWVDVNL